MLYRFSVLIFYHRLRTYVNVRNAQDMHDAGKNCGAVYTRKSEVIFFSLDYEGILRDFLDKVSLRL